MSCLTHHVLITPILNHNDKFGKPLLLIAGFIEHAYTYWYIVMNPNKPTKPTITPATPTNPTTPASPSYRALNKRAGQIARVVGLLFAILAIGSALGFYIAKVNKDAVKPTGKDVQIKNLTPEELSKLSSLGANVGTTDQLFTVGATAQFNNNVIVNKNLSVNGSLNANGPVTLKSLTITGGESTLGGLNVGGNLGVTGATILQNGATIGKLLSLTGNLAVAGTATFNALSSSNITVSNLTITGPLSVGHLSTKGPLPSSSTGSAVGGGGTSSLSGNDTAGTANISLGSGTSAGVLINITFKSPYSGTVRVLLTPLTGASAAANVYVTRTATGFQIRTDTALPAGSALSYDYFVIQ